ncbi:EAL domain-containing protein [Thiorhodococcus minor]|uniref:EAL domain-containing protein n=1 Tax=Thiorhodococcus minor TaxID=57489 RepID=A0A6M0JTB9_9GAMM|nr:EAL domain-containing protein [Thiorhodococcus minor]NEV60722.1 EAL domain-containing protein [Thiorhodococcus minor]
MSQPFSTSIRIGVMPPLSGLGGLYGPEMSLATQIACDELNAAGGILGKPVELIIADDGGLPETAIQTARRLLDLGCVALVANLPANTRSAVATQVAEPRESPYLNCSFYEGSLYGRYFFSFGALPNQQTERMIGHLAKVVGAKMFFVGSGQEWERTTMETAAGLLREQGGDVLGMELVGTEIERTDPILERVKCSGADIVMPFFEGETQIRFLKRLCQLGLKQHFAVVMCNFDEAIAAMLPPEVREGLYASGAYFMSVETAANARFLRAIAALNEAQAAPGAGKTVVTSHGEAAYLAIHALAQAAGTAESLDPAALVRCLEQVQVEGPQGKVRMDALTHHAQVNDYLARCSFDGSFETLKHFGARQPVIPERYRYCLPPLERAEIGPSGGEPTTEPGLSVAIAGVDSEGKIALFNPTLRTLWGLPEDEELIGLPVTALWDDEARLAEISPTLTRAPEWRGTLTARRADGTLKRLAVVAEPLRHRDREIAGYTLACMDTRARLVPQGEACGHVLDMADVAILAADAEGIVIKANRRVGELFGYGGEELIGLSVHVLVPPQYREQHAHQVAGFVRGAMTERPMGLRSEVTGLRKDGSVFPAEVSISKIRVDGRWLLVATLNDITDRKLAEHELVWHASHDSLTGLPNRTLIHDQLTRALLRSKRQSHGVALLFIDLDGFKLVNDAHGHATGDDLLKMIAWKLLDQVRPGDTVGRLGGDELVILCDRVESPNALTALAERINEMLRTPLEVQGHQLFATASIGLAMGHGTTHSADDLLRNADAAMYKAKEHGRDGWRFFSEEIHQQVRERLDITNGLRQAIERGELQVRFQPILGTESEIVRGAELLLRWLPAEGEIPPARFIPIAEMTGSIVPIGKWVFAQACAAEAAWRARFAERAPYVSVNLSARQLNDDTLVQSVAAILEETGADPSRVLLELTETSLMTDVSRNLDILKQLADLGMHVAVDDFGTGYSSLSQLLRMPVSTLKIDREFVDGIEREQDSKAIVSAVTSMARAMQLKVVAEGVETEGQLRYLRDLGCNYVQGYHFYRPMPPAELEQLLATQSASQAAEPADALYTLLYVSVASEPMSDRALSDLLQGSRAKNRSQGITGFLLYLNGSFLQVLEGSRQQVQTLVETIAKDPRHHSIRTLYEGPIARRAFADWSMGFRNMSHMDQGFDFKAWQVRTLSFVEMSEDPEVCYNLITALAR